MSYNGREALQLALGSAQNAQYDPNRNALTTVSLNSDGTDALLKRARAFEKFLDKSDKRSRSRDSELKSDTRGAQPSDGEATGFSVPNTSFSVPEKETYPTPTTEHFEAAAEQVGLGNYDLGWNAAIDRILQEGDNLAPDFELKQSMVRDFIKGLRK